MEEKDKVIDPTTQAAVIHQLIEKVKTYYIFPEAAEKICAHIQKTYLDGEYADLKDGDLFALGLTIQLQEINQDEHLWVRWHAKAIPSGEVLRLNPTWLKHEKDRAKRQNFGIYRLSLLPGNIGYVDIHYFHRPAWAGEKMVNVMQFLAPTQVAILDLRKCTGGYPHMIALACSYLFEAEPFHLFSIYWRDEDFTQQYWTLPYVPNQRFPDKPLYVLTSQKTFSGGETLAEILQSRKRAMIVGEKTDGGAHPGTSFFLHPHFEAFIPIGRTINPLTGRDFERKGVTPDIILPADKSFDMAYKLALQEILTRLKRDQPQSERLINEIGNTLNNL